MKKLPFILIISLLIIIGILIYFNLSGHRINSNDDVSMTASYIPFPDTSDIYYYLNSVDRLSPHKVIFVKKDIYSSGKARFVFKGTIRNIYKFGIKDVYVGFFILNNNDSDYFSHKAIIGNYYSPSVFADKFDYLPPNENVDFSISIDTEKHFLEEEYFRAALQIQYGNFYVDIFRLNNP